MINNRKVLVMGATGQQGGSVARTLLTAGYRVRAMTRSGASAGSNRLRDLGSEIVEGDLKDRGSLLQVMEGIDTVYAMTTPFEAGVQAESEQGLAAVDAAREAHVGHFVFSSVANADKATGIPHFDSKYEVEKALEASGLNYTIVAPVFFMENLVSPWWLPGLQGGKLAMAMEGSRFLQQIALANIGEFVTSVIKRRESVFGQRFDIAGDEITGEKAAEAIAEVSGKDILYEGFSPDAMREQNEDFAIMFDWFESVGYSADIAKLRTEFPEVNWQDFRGWARDQDWSILEPVSTEV